MARNWTRFHTVSRVSGSSMSRATSLMKRWRECDPAMPKKPRPFESLFRYATAFVASSSAWASTHSVEPSSAGSSPSQAA